MTHPIVEAVRRQLAHLPEQQHSSAEETFFATHIVAEVLRLAREPSEGVIAALDDAWIDGDNDDVWRAGIDALLREVEG